MGTQRRGEKRLVQLLHNSLFTVLEPSNYKSYSCWAQRSGELCQMDTERKPWYDDANEKTAYMYLI